MFADRRQALEEVGFVWDPHRESAWEEGFAVLTMFKAHEKHCRVPAVYTEGTFTLGNWVRKQRTRKGTMSADHRRRLNEIGFVWDVLEDAWEEGFTALTKFKTCEGHCRVPRGKNEGAFRLGDWVSYQRNCKDTMSAERRQRLDKIGFIWRGKFS
jgi:hypothetical protein